MKKSANKSKNKNNNQLFPSDLQLPKKAKKWVGGIILVAVSLMLVLGFFDMAGVAGQILSKTLFFLTGNTALALPVIVLFAGIIYFVTKQERFEGVLALSCLILVVAASGFVAALNITQMQGGYLGYYLAMPLKVFGFWATIIIFCAAGAVSAVLFWWMLGQPMPSFSNDRKKEKRPLPVAAAKTSLMKRIFERPVLNVKPVPSLPTFAPDRRVVAKDKDAAAVAVPKTAAAAFRETIPYKKPPLELLDVRKSSPLAGDVRQNQAIIKKTLENFGIPVEMTPEINVGPAVTQYTLKPAEGVKLSKITALANDLSLSLASSSIRIEAPIPGKSLVGVEVPNRERAGIGLRELLSTSQFTQSNAPLQICLGKDVIGSPIYADITRMPHLMVAGATGTGKTIFLNSVLTSLLYRNPPETLRLILVDPKRVEMRAYNNLPHMLTPVIYDVQKTVAALKWAIGEMNRRFDLIGEKESRNIASYNEKCAKDGDEPLPYIVFVIDELADLMATKGKDIEAGIVRLAQMARAVGIHLVVATQRPSVEVITGLIKANITCRVAFQVASQIDSRTILDMAGAEKLIGMGDMLFMSAEYPKPKRIQGPYISEKESKRVLEWIKENNAPPEFKIEDEVLDSLMVGDLGRNEYGGQNSMFAASDAADSGFGEDPLYEQAKKIVIEARKASASFLQRRLRIGYSRAARLIDILEERGVVGAGDGAKPRDILASADDGATAMPVEPDKGGQDGSWSKV